jgi:hypothetical protein
VSQEGLNKARKELEEVRKREIKIKEKLKEFLDLQGFFFFHFTARKYILDIMYKK